MVSRGRKDGPGMLQICGRAPDGARPVRGSEAAQAVAGASSKAGGDLSDPSRSAVPGWPYRASLCSDEAIRLAAPIMSGPRVSRAQAGG